MKTFPILYKKTSTGAIAQWQIAAFDNTIQTIHGQVGGKLQTTTDTLKEGKNEGKTNATSVNEQTEKEAKAKWTKQKKKGYVETIEAAEAGETDEVVEGGYLPMLAPNKSYPSDDELQKRIEYPCFYQNKLDGMRCVAIVENGICTIWSRTRKKINSVPHINKALEEMFPTGRVVPDGELYNHEYRDTFEDLLSILRKDEPDSEGLYKEAEYHLYDLLEQNILPVHTDSNTPYEGRLNALKAFKYKHPIKLVETKEAKNLEELHSFFEESEENGYEGGMAKNKYGKYKEGKRSTDQQKMKRFIELEFNIIGAEDGRGKDAGTVAKFVCITDEGKEFKPRLKATYARRRELMNDPKQWQGKKLTVRFKRWTNGNVPYIPTGRAIRDYE